MVKERGIEEITDGPTGPIPRDVRAAIDLMRRSLSEPLSMSDLAQEAGVPERTLSDHFRIFVGHSPIRYFTRLRLAAARESILSERNSITITEVAHRFGFANPGRFSGVYRRLFGELPSETRVRARSVPISPRLSPHSHSGRPLLAIVAMPSFDASGTGHRHLVSAAADLTDSLSGALTSVRILAPHDRIRGEREASKADYILEIRAKAESGRALAFRLRNTVDGALVWAGRTQSVQQKPNNAIHDLAQMMTEGLEAAIEADDIRRATERRALDLDARGLSMKALPLLFSSTPEGAARALDLLRRAMDLDPDHPGPVALAAWAHGQQVMYNATSEPGKNREAARSLARRALVFGADRPMELTALAAVHTMLGDFDLAETLVARALAEAPRSGWAWGRSGWLHAYRGEARKAQTHFRRALRCGPRETRANVLAGIGSTHFAEGRYGDAARTLHRALLEQPAMEWCRRSLSVCYARLGERNKAQRSIRKLMAYQPDLTISSVVDAIPYQPDFIERLANGLDDLGVPH